VQDRTTLESTGVKRLYELTQQGTYKNHGLHIWGLYRIGMSEPSIASVWEAPSEKVIDVNRNAFMVRYEKVDIITARTIEVTSEVRHTK
jgi:hypothetical protein